MRDILSKRLILRGFIVSDCNDQAEPFYRDMSEWFREGKVRYRVNIIEGLEKAPEAFIGLLEGRNFGKLIIKVSL
jgi:NADPH-dependent curcumin reductase CurA